MLKRFAVVLLMLCFTACQSNEAVAPVAASGPQPLLWKVSDADSAVYLLGSFHLLEASDYPLPPATDAAFDDSRTVVFELSPEEMNDPALGQKMAQAAMRQDGKTLEASLPADTWKALEAYTERKGMPLANFQPFEAWFVSLIISVTELQAAGLDPSMGLDKHFAARAVEAGKQVSGLETGAQQIALFDGMTEAQQQQALQETLDGLDEMQVEIGKMLALWRAGDADGLYDATALEMKTEYPELYNRVNRDRNLAWVPRITAMLDGSDGDNTLVVVGAMHLLGDDGVVELLRAKGYQVERL